MNKTFLIWLILIELCVVKTIHAQITPPANTFILDLTLPEGATIESGGRDFGERKKLTWNNLTRGKQYAVTVQVNFPSGATVERKIRFKGGKRLHLAMTDPRVNRPHLVVQTEKGWVQCYALSQDGKYLAYGTNDGAATIWDVKTGRKLRDISVAPFGANSIAVSPDNKLVAIGTVYEVGVRNTFDDTIKERLKSNINFSKHTSFSPDGKLFVECGRSYSPERHQTNVWDLANGTKRYSITHASAVNCLTFEPSGKRFIVGIGTPTGTKEDGAAIMFDLQNGEEVGRFDEGRAVTAIVVSKDGKHLVTAKNWSQYDKGSSTQHASLTSWNLNDKSRIWSNKYDQSIRSIAIKPDSSQILYGSETQEDLGNYRKKRTSFANLIDMSDGKPVADLTLKKYDSNAFVSYLPSGKKFLVGSTVFDTQTQKRIREINGVGNYVYNAAFSPNGQQLLLDDTLWDLSSGRPLRKFAGHRMWFSPSGRYLCSWVGETPKHSLVLWDPQTGNQIVKFDTKSEFGGPYAFSPDGRTVITRVNESRKKEFAAWDVRSGRKIRTMDFSIETFGAPSRIVWHPRGDQIIASYSNAFQPYDGPLLNMSIWDAKTSRFIRASKYDYAWGTILVSPDKRNIITGEFAKGNSTDLLLIDPSNDRIIRRFKGPDIDQKQPIAYEISLSGDGKKIAATYRGGRALVWDFKTASKVRDIQAHDCRFVNACALNHDGSRLVTGASDGTARLWDIDTGQELARLVDVDDEENWLVVTPDGLFDGTERGRQAVTYRVGVGLNVVPVDRFFQDFYRPGLLSEIYSGKRPLPTVSIGNKLAPQVKIISPEAQSVSDLRAVTIKVEVADQGGGIRGPWLTQNGSRILARSETKSKGDATLHTFRVPLVSGKNKIEVRAASEDGSWESEPDSIVVDFQSALAKSELYVLAIGVNKYADEKMNLKYAAPDATSIANVFQQRGPGLYGASKVHILKLLDEKATREAIKTKLSEIAKKANPQDTLVVFLAGHGTTIGQRYFFIPHDFQKESDNLEDDIRQQGLAGDVLGDFLAEVPALKRVLIFDTCQSGGTIGFQRTSRNPFAFRGALERLSRAQGIFTMAATAASEDAQEVEDLGHGVLTYALLAGLKAVNKGPLRTKSAQNKSNLIDVRDWFSFAQDNVPLITKLYFGKEQFVGFSGQGQSFPILPLTKD